MAGSDRAGLPVDLSGIAVTTFTAEGDTVGIIDFDGPLPDVARYLVRIEGVTDVVGNPLAGDNDRVLTALAGDANGDLRINAIDLSYIWPRRTGQIDGASLVQVRPDVNCDGRVNAIDLSATWPRRGPNMQNVPDPVLPGKPGIARTSGDAPAEAAALAGTRRLGGQDPSAGADALTVLPVPGLTPDVPTASPARPTSPAVATVPIETGALEVGAAAPAAAVRAEPADALSLPTLIAL